MVTEDMIPKYLDSIRCRESRVCRANKNYHLKQIPPPHIHPCLQAVMDSYVCRNRRTTQSHLQANPLLSNARGPASNRKEIRMFINTEWCFKAEPRSPIHCYEQSGRRTASTE